MPAITLTDFIDFVLKTGTPKQTKVRQLKQRGEYDKKFDFWKLLREKIIQFHRNGESDKNSIDHILRVIDDEKKKGRYPEAIEGYKKFLGRKQIKWFNPINSLWSFSTLSIRIRPELGLIYNGTRHLVKLHFKDEKLNKKEITVASLLNGKHTKASL